MSKEIDLIVWDAAKELYLHFFNEVRLGSEDSSIVQVHEVLSDEKFEKAFIKAIAHHFTHIKDTRLNQGTVDIYKALSWITWFMSKGCSDETVKNWSIVAGLESLNDCLTNDHGVCLPQSTINLLEAFLKNEIAGIYEHGIALNGLFLSFHSATEALKQSSPQPA